VPPAKWINELTEEGAIHIYKEVEEAKRDERDMHCLYTGQLLKDMAEVKKYVALPAYADVLVAEKRRAGERPCTGN